MGHLIRAVMCVITGHRGGNSERRYRALVTPGRELVAPDEPLSQERVRGGQTLKLRRVARVSHRGHGLRTDVAAGQRGSRSVR